MSVLRFKNVNQLIVRLILAAALCLPFSDAFALTRGLAVNSSVTIGSSSTQVLGTDTFRGYLFIFNPNTTATFWCNLNGGTAAANASGSVFFGTSASLIMDSSVPTSPVTCIGSTTGVIVTIYVITNVQN